MAMNLETGAFSLEDPYENLPPGVLSDLRRMAWFAFLGILAVEVLVLTILFCVLPSERPKRPPGAQLKTLIVLGSGGHTAEMLRLVGSLDRKVYNPRVYVSAETDTMSTKKARAYEEQAAADGLAAESEYYAIPRSREVGQSYFTSIFTTLRAQLVAAAMIWQLSPDVLLVNGPGTCIPLCLVAFLLRRIGVKYCDVVYVESIARVKSLSLSGRILYKLGMADEFLVQWPELQKLYPKAKFVDRLY